MKREIIKIDKEKCTGCGDCVPNCHEGALQIIDGKAMLVSELMCDGLGACIGHCPEGAITIEEREAEAYDEMVVLKRIIPEGKNVLIAHLSHLKEHEQDEYLEPAFKYLRQNAGDFSFSVDEVMEKVNGTKKKTHAARHAVVAEAHQHHGGGCPGSLSRTLRIKEDPEEQKTTVQSSMLTNWPVQMHLINPNAPYFRNADLLLAADCVAYASGSFHQKYLKGKSLIIACPKLDVKKEIYVEKLISLIDVAGISSITVMKMEVPCCSGLLQIAHAAKSQSEHDVRLECITVGIDGNEQ